MNPFHPLRIGVFLAVLLLEVVALAGGTDLDKIAASAPGRDDLPDADAVILKEVRTITLDGTGRRTERTYRLVKVFTPLGRNRFADPRFSIRDGFQTFKVLRARTRMRDGTVVETPPNGINIVTPRPLMNAPAYASRREAVVSHVGIEMDSLLEIEVEIADRKGGRRGIDGVEVFGARVPILEKTLVIELPKGLSLKSEVVGSAWFIPDRGEVNKSGRWTLKNIPGTPEEPHAPPMTEFRPRVVYSTWPSWRHWGDPFSDRFNGSVEAHLPDDLRRKLEEIRDKKKSAGERIAALDALLAKRVHTIRHPFETFELRPASRTWSEGYGHALDRGALFCAALRVLGLSGRPVWFAGSRTPLEDEVVSPSQLKTLWVLARDGEREYWIDPLGRVMETGFLCPPFLRRFFPGNAKKVGPEPGRLPAHSDREADVFASVHLRPDGSASVNLFVELKGALNPCFRQWAGEGDPRDFVEEKLERVFKKGTIRKQIDVQVGPEATQIAIEMTVPEAVKMDGGRACLALPETIFLPAFELPSSDRTLPYRFPGAMAERVNLRVHYPETWKVIASPATFSGNVKSAIRVSVLGWKRGRYLPLFRAIAVDGNDIGEVHPPPAGEKMKTFRALLSRWKSEASRTVIFETGK